MERSRQKTGQAGTERRAGITKVSLSAKRQIGRLHSAHMLCSLTVCSTLRLMRNFCKGDEPIVNGRGSFSARDTQLVNEIAVHKQVSRTAY